ncbi:high-affinity nickel-transport protein [Roseateles sp. YR242]|uniref:HoxN/HupN/NixA family nickel/cobalt transporter n=1 Tax=Roseateles sp. YR242 TaxID=1855305 RepID=UPI0008C6E923|nr:nickel transporter [Roseateles sp. YR242]SEL85774.1 high-affinity nickel-transport protein [Roseateles sp. YR242]
MSALPELSALAVLSAHWPAAWPAGGSALCVIALLLGLQHGMDADHLAAIDGLTRLNTRRGRRFARWCGALFAAGHGLVVLAVAVGANRLSQHLAVPHWLEAGGSLFSIALLTLLGVGNLAAVLRPADPGGGAGGGVGGRAGAEAVDGLVMRRWRWKWIQAQRPASVALVGGLFALSFDTISQAAVFALAAGHSGGAGQAATLALLFAGGMLVADGAGGLWIARLIRRADRLAPISSQAMTMSLAVLSLLVAAVGAARMLTPPQGDAGSGLMFGGVVLLLSGAGYVVACWMARWPWGGARQRRAQ